MASNKKHQGEAKKSTQAAAQSKKAVAKSKAMKLRKPQN